MLFLGNLGVFEILVVLVFVLAPFILACWLVVAAIRWLNRH